MVLIEWLLALLIFLIPSNLFLKLWPESAYVNGVLVDYLIPKVHLSEIVLWMLISGLLFMAKRAGKLNDAFNFNLRKNWFSVLLVIGIFLRQFFTLHPLAGLESISNWLGICILLWIFSSRWGLKLLTKLRRGTAFFTSVLATISFQSILGIYQFLAQKSYAGYWFLGEGNLNSIGKISKTIIGGREVVLPMGTTPHPNILAGTLAVLILILTWNFINFDRKQKNNWQLLYFVSVSLGIICLVLTMSISGWLSFLAGLLVLTYQKHLTKITNNKQLIIFGLTLFLVPIFINRFAHNFDQSWQRRAYLNQAGWSEFVTNPVFGVGLQNSSALIEKFATEREVVRFVQPPHHVGILLLAETGLLGLLLISQIKLRKNKSSAKWIWMLLPIMALDHYLLTTYPGNLLLMLIAMVWVTDSDLDLESG